jgi:hypothetical protein
MGKLERELIEYSQQIENDSKKVERMEREIQVIDNQIKEERTFEIELEKKLGEMKENLLPKLQTLPAEEKEELNNRLVMDPIGALKAGVANLLKRITENAEKYKGKSINEVASIKFDPQLGYILDEIIIPAFISIFNGGFQTFWFSRVHFWQIIEHLLSKKLEEVKLEEKDELEKSSKVIQDILDDVKMEVSSSDYDELTFSFFKNCIMKKCKFNLFF